MKRILLLIVICSLFTAKANAGHIAIEKKINHNFKQFLDTNILVLDSIMLLNLSYYIGKPVDSLLQVLPQSPKTIRITSSDKPHLASRLIVTYDNWYWLQIVVKNFQYMPVYDPNRLWDFNLFKNETISWIFVNQGNKCVYGCTGSRFRN